MWASANNPSEVNFFSAADAATACVYGGLSNGNEKIATGTYLGTVASASQAPTGAVPGQALHTKAFYWLQQLINNWPSVVASGQPLPL